MSELRIHIEGGDLLQQDAIRSTVRGIYGAVRPTDRRVANRFYRLVDLDSLPDETVRSALGVGNPVAHADLRPGETVVDLGSGGGIDCLLAGRAVGPTGSVIGVDFLEDMVDRGRRAAAEAGLANVQFMLGEIEELPLDDASIDVVISNGVPNLSPRKTRVMAEAFRVLRPGGRLAIADLLLDGGLPPEIQTHPAAWAGCLSGALSERAMYTALRRAGFRAVSIETIEAFGIDECALYPLFTPQLLDLLRHLVPAERINQIATSALIRARRPASGEVLPGRAPHD
ncbi:MAG TPA: methyltransferase domain-containing protein [Candidatus Limnocylindrales bacterium]|jgi:ubiquinone/menaquinone biosynthesis C-methylase UbiE|nr:methyltransferase domain-containing protein [Candidatus Limnocylindrales bacterium]